MVEQRDTGADFAIRNDFVGQLPWLPRDISESLMSLHLSLRESDFATNINVYAPAVIGLDKAKTKFCKDLHAPWQIILVVQQLSSGNASDSRAIPAEIYKQGDHRLMDQLTTLVREMWDCGQLPQDFKGATTVHPYKLKGNRQVCDNHRDISLLNIAGKILVTILLNHLNGYLELGLLPECQFVF
nr:unnamed protein product [Spirometra erinaceieuropaei]